MAQVQGQENNVFTKAVQLESLIPFIVENYKPDEEAEQSKNITFLIPVGQYGLSEDALFVLNQSFKLLATRLNEDDLISVVVYSGLNGEILNAVDPSELKSILYAINNIEKSIPQLHEDGIQLAYEIANDNFDEDAINSVVMIRSSKQFEMQNASATNAKPKNGKGSMILLTLIGLAPEIISALKD